MGCFAILAVMLFRSRQRRAALVLAALVAGTLALGAGAVLASLPLRVVLAHNLAAAVLLAALVVVSYRIRAKAG